MFFSLLKLRKNGYVRRDFQQQASILKGLTHAVSEYINIQEYVFCFSFGMNSFTY